ncbi:hypothetical protein JOF29_006570 [Kribbella aluminosa]|uniref:Uncharacterized protein n=1 Tax=Kribbella aluminosa TaxID=416017 RepID=A0ABS4UUY4_9ACTN|nr:hypothetical protein [Kribbella aluminosa]MBP2355460.1 hypothetical protein [Kribbella aluminosa]
MIGRELAFVLFRHEARLSDAARTAARTAVRTAVRTALGHAARSIIRRNVAMSYTNIAAKGTFVTLAAGQLLKDAELTEYAVRRVGRLREQTEAVAGARWAARRRAALGELLDELAEGDRTLVLYAHEIAQHRLSLTMTGFDDYSPASWS